MGDRPDESEPLIGSVEPVAAPLVQGFKSDGKAIAVGDFGRSSSHADKLRLRLLKGHSSIQHRRTQPLVPQPGGPAKCHILRPYLRTETIARLNKRQQANPLIFSEGRFGLGEEGGEDGRVGWDRSCEEKNLLGSGLYFFTFGQRGSFGRPNL